MMSCHPVVMAHDVAEGLCAVTKATNQLTIRQGYYPGGPNTIRDFGWWQKEKSEALDEEKDPVHHCSL